MKKQCQPDSTQHSDGLSAKNSSFAGAREMEFTRTSESLFMSGHRARASHTQVLTGMAHTHPDALERKQEYIDGGGVELRRGS